MKSLGIFPSHHWDLEEANWRWTMEKFQLLLVIPPGCLSSSCSTRGVVRSCHSWAWLSFLVFVSTRHINNKTQNYTWAKFSWCYSRLGPRPLAVCSSSFVWKWDDLCLKITCKLELNVKSRLCLVSTGSHFEIWGHFDAEIQSKTQGAEAGEIQAYIKQNWKENICINPEKQNQDSHLSGFSKKYNLSLRTNELGRKTPSQFLIWKWTT